MIDLHCHVLPALDDGAIDVEDSVAMARQGEADGVEVICATPHIRHDHDVLVRELPRRVATLNGELRRREVAVTIVTGGEVAETALPGLDDEELRALTLGGRGGWILLEPAPGPLGDSLVSAVKSLSARGFGTVLAHPERHAAADVAERLRALVELGALVQVTAAMLEHGDAAALIGDLAAEGLVHLLGSDAHSARGGRPVRLSGALERLEAVPLLRPHLDWIAHAGPAAVIGNGPVEPPFRPPR